MNALDWAATIKHLRRMEGEVVQVGVATGEHLPIRFYGRLTVDPAERSRFALVAGTTGTARPRTGVLEIAPALFRSAELDGGLLTVRVGDLEVVVMKAQE